MNPFKLFAEIDRLKKLLAAEPPYSPRAEAISWQIEELETGVDTTAEEWSEAAATTREAVLEAQVWKLGFTSKRPSAGWSRKS